MRTGRILVVVTAVLAASVPASSATAGGAACFEPVPDPFAAGWSRDPSGSDGSVTVAAPLIIEDSNTLGGQFTNLVCADAALFDAEIVLTPRVRLGTGFSTAAEGSTGVHVTINDGVRLIRAALLQGPSPEQVRVVILKASGRISTGFTFSTLTAEFTLRRLVNGDAVLEVAGQQPETVEADQLPPTPVTTKRLEFGTYDTTAASSSFWERLGLPKAALPATLALDPGTLNLRAKGRYLTAYLESSAFDVAAIDVSTLRLKVISPFTSAEVAVPADAPTALGDGNGNGIVDLMVKFARAAVQSWFSADATATVRAEGKLSDGRGFAGEAALGVINAGADHTNESNPASVQP